MKEMHNSDFMHILDDTVDYKVATHRVSAISHSTKHMVTAQFMGGRKFFEVGIATFNLVGKFCGRQRILEFVCDVAEYVEQVRIGGRRYYNLIHAAWPSF